MKSRKRIETGHSHLDETMKKEKQRSIVKSSGVLFALWLGLRSITLIATAGIHWGSRSVAGPVDWALRKALLQLSGGGQSVWPSTAINLFALVITLVEHVHRGSCFHCSWTQS